MSFVGDQASFYQPSIQASHFIGNEVVESTVFSSSQTSWCPYSTNVCRFSDLVLGSYSDQSKGLVGYIFGTTSRSTRIGSRTLDQPLPISDKVLWPILYDEVHKIGQRTGWTYGQVVETCADAWASRPGQQFYFLCWNGVSAGSYSGDSGAAVFYFDQPNYQAALVGQLFAGYSGLTVVSGDTTYNRFAFSSMNNLQAEFGNLIATIHGWY